MLLYDFCVVWADVAHENGEKVLQKGLQLVFLKFPVIAPALAFSAFSPRRSPAPRRPRTRLSPFQVVQVTLGGAARRYSLALRGGRLR